MIDSREPYRHHPNSGRLFVDCFVPWKVVVAAAWGEVPFVSFRTEEDQRREQVGKSSHCSIGNRGTMTDTEMSIPSLIRSMIATALGQFRQCMRGWRYIGSATKGFFHGTVAGQSIELWVCKGDLRGRRHRFPSRPRSRGPRRTRRCPRDHRWRRCRSR